MTLGFRIIINCLYVSHLSGTITPVVRSSIIFINKFCWVLLSPGLGLPMWQNVTAYYLMAVVSMWLTIAKFEEWGGAERSKHASRLHTYWCFVTCTTLIGIVHDCRSANVVGMRNVNTVLLNKKIDFQELLIN